MTADIQILLPTEVFSEYETQEVSYSKGLPALYQAEPQRDLACMVFLRKKELSQ